VSLINISNANVIETINSTVVVKNNESFVIGGLTKTTKDYTVRRFPVLGYILPFIFSSKVVNDINSELAFVITPHIVETPITSPEDLKALEKDLK
jgi:Flp pilus assembly secretin CpaC